MTDVRPLDLAFLRRWIDPEKTAEERVTHGLAERLGATFEEHTRADGTSATVPQMLHWCLAPPAVRHVTACGGTSRRCRSSSASIAPEPRGTTRTSPPSRVLRRRP